MVILIVFLFFNVQIYVVFNYCYLYYFFQLVGNKSNLKRLVPVKVNKLENYLVIH